MILDDKPQPIWREVATAFLCTVVTVGATKAIEHFYETWKEKRKKGGTG